MREVLINLMIYLSIMSVSFIVLSFVLAWNDIHVNLHIGLGLTLLISVGLFMAFGVGTKLVVGAVLYLILFYASASDLEYREVTNWIPALILAMGLIMINSSNWSEMLLGGIFAALPLVIASIVTPLYSIGGADIKIMFAIGFLLGIEGGLLTLILGLVLFVAVISIIRSIRGYEKAEPAAMIPYFATSAMAIYFVLGCI